MPKLYLLGGEFYNPQKISVTYKKIFTELQGSPIVLIFPWTSWYTTSHKNKFRAVMEEYFKRFGAKKIIFAELTDTIAQLKAKVSVSNIIYLLGGETNFFVKRLAKRNLHILFKNYKGIIVGNSAGALALCEKYAVIKGQDGRSTTKFEPGIGVVDFPVSVHYNSSIKQCSGENSDEAHRQLSRKAKVYAIEEGSALVYEDNLLRAIGNVYAFHKGKKNKI